MLGEKGVEALRRVIRLRGPKKGTAQDVNVYSGRDAGSTWDILEVR